MQCQNCKQKFEISMELENEVREKIAQVLMLLVKDSNFKPKLNYNLLRVLEKISNCCDNPRFLWFSDVD